MLKIFKSKEETTEVSEKSKYSPEIDNVHKEFENAAEILYNEAISILTANKINNKDKIERLKSLGFCAVKEVVEVVEKEKKLIVSQETIKLISEYKIKYPLNRFITEGQVRTICEKYGLVWGEISRFKGFVPEKNLVEIEKFYKKYSFQSMAKIVPYSTFPKTLETIVSIAGAIITNPVRRYGHLKLQTNPNVYLSMQMEESDWDGKNFYGEAIVDGVKFDARLSVIGLQIAAPEKDFDMTAKDIVDFEIVAKQKPAEDPVILQPVKGGFLIVTAWGDEASDPLVVNEINN